MAETSATLLERLSNRDDADAWRRLVDLYTPLIHGWLRRHGAPPADADDLAQEVLGIVVRELPRFRHNRRTGAFRAWLRTITTNCLRQSWHARRLRERNGFGPFLDELEDPASDLSRLWDREHDQHVVGRLLESIQGDFRPSTWLAFKRLALDGAEADEVAAELGLTVNAVLIARSRVLQRLRQFTAGFVD